MSGGRMFISPNTPERNNELTSKAYVDTSIESTHDLLDSRHQALSNNHGGTRQALQQLIQSIHGTNTILADGANAFTLVASEWEQYKATTNDIQVVMASKTDLEDYVKSADLDTAVVDSADRLRNGARINTVLFDGTQDITLDTVTTQDLADTLAQAQYATKADLADYTKTADQPSTSSDVFVYLPAHHLVTTETWQEVTTDVVHSLTFTSPTVSVSAALPLDPDSIPRWVVAFGQTDINEGYQSCSRTALITIDGGSTYLLNCSTPGGGTNRNRSSPFLVVPENDGLVCYVWRHSDQCLGIVATPGGPTAALPSTISFVDETRTVPMSANRMHSVIIRHRRTGTGIECTFMVDAVKKSIFVTMDSIGSSSWGQGRLGIGSWGTRTNGAHLNLRATKIKMWPYALADGALVSECLA